MDDSNNDMSEEYKTEELLMQFQVAGGIAVVMYSILTLVILYRLYLHIVYKSNIKRIGFHMALLIAILCELPRGIYWMFYSTTETWIGIFILHLVSDLIQCFCLAYISISWAKAASFGRRKKIDVKTFRRIVIVTNCFVFAWVCGTVILLSNYMDDSEGEAKFVVSTLNYCMVAVSCIVLLATSVTLLFQGSKIHQRLLQVRCTMSEASVQKSMHQLKLFLWVIMFSVILKIFFAIGSVAELPWLMQMDMVPYFVWSNLVPVSFPTMCLLYFQRRISRRSVPSDQVSFVSSQN